MADGRHNAVADQSVRSFGHWIDGREMKPDDKGTIDSTNPLTGEVVCRIAAGGASEVDAAMQSARRAAIGWGRLSQAERSRHLLRFATALRSRAGEIADLEVAETGKPAALARIEADGVADYLEYYAGVIRAFHGDTIDIGHNNRVFSNRVPYGIVGVISPWNAPVYSAVRGAAPALAAGNAVVIKPSEYTSTTTLAFARIATQAGMPDGVVNVVTGYGADTGAAIVSHRATGKVSFTGSVATGRIVARLAAERLIPVVLELGGKSPNIVFADADLEKAAQAAFLGFTMNAGQVCAAGTRILVERSVEDAFVGRLKQLLAAGADAIGPIITDVQHEKVSAYIAQGLREGATAIAGPAREGMSQHIAPTLFVDVTNSMTIAREEIFGPVACIIPFDTEEEAVAVANDSSYGLVSAVWTKNIDRAFRVASRLETGQVFVNQYGTLDVETPFGGMKNSGYGREKGIEALREFTQVKSVLIKIED